MKSSSLLITLLLLLSVTSFAQQKIKWNKDGAKMVLIPAGSFEMGDHFNEGQASERPVHRVELDAFYMDIHEVTVGQFNQFVEESGYAYNRWQDVTKYSPGDDYPMVYVSWHDIVRLPNKMLKITKVNLSGCLAVAV